MKRKVSILILLSLLMLTLTLFASCSEKEEIVMTVGGIPVSYDMVKYFSANYLSAYTEKELEDPTIRAQIKENVIGSLKELYTYKKLAKELGVSLDKKTKSEIVNEIDKYIDENGKASLKEHAITRAVYIEICQIEALCDLVYDKLTVNATDDRFKSDNATIDADLASGSWFSAEYMYIYYTKDNKEDVFSDISSAKDRINGGESMKDVYDELLHKYSKDATYAIDGCFTYSIYNEVVEDTILSLDIGALSDVIEYGEGSYMIIRRLKIDDDYVDKNYYNIIAQYLSREFFEYINEYSESVTYEMCEGYEDLDFCNMK